MKIKVSSVSVEPHSGFHQILEFEPDSTNEILSQIDDSDMINYVGVDKFVKEVDNSEILELIPVDEIIEYLQNKGMTELN